MNIIYKGQLGNNIFQYAVALLFSKNNNFILEKPYFVEKLNIDFYEGENNDNGEIVIINDDNFLDLLDKDLSKNKLYFDGYFQKKDFILEYYDYLENIFLNEIPLKKDGFLIHARLYSLPKIVTDFNYEYYSKKIDIMINDNTNLKDNYIITDYPNSQIVIDLVKNYNLKLYHKNQYDDLLFSLKFDNLILSEGTYSFWVGVMSRSNNVICYDNISKWHGDIFVNPKWIKK